MSYTLHTYESLNYRASSTRAGNLAERRVGEDRVAQGEIIRKQLEKARASSDVRSFMRLAGAVRGPRNLSSRKGFSPRCKGSQTPAFSWRSPTALTAIASELPVSIVAMSAKRFH